MSASPSSTDDDIEVSYEDVKCKLEYGSVDVENQVEEDREAGASWQSDDVDAAKREPSSSALPEGLAPCLDPYPYKKEPSEKELAPPEKRSLISFLSAIVDTIKYVYSMGLLIFSVVVVMAAIFSKQTSATAEKNIHPLLAFFLFWFLIVWLAIMEGGQGCLVGLEPVDKALYASSHPKALKNTKLVHEGDNMERFIVGRQFLAVLVLFVINLMAFAVEGASVLGLPSGVAQVFLASGLSVILVTITLGQLTAQVNAANCMLDFVNNYMMLFTTHVSLAIEFSGLLHSVYLVQIIFAKLSGRPSDSTEPRRTTAQLIFFWARVFVSLSLLGFAFAVTLSALFDGNTTMWDGIPTVVSVVVFFVLMCFVGMMEGMQIALFAVVNLPEEELQHHPMAYKTCQLTFKGTNLKAFLIGRQICVTICMFVVARITTLDMDEGEPNVFGVSDGAQEFLNTGLLGALITTIVASLAWRIVASSCPVGFLSNPLAYVIVRLCLVLEASGVCSAAWVLAYLQKRLVGYHVDETYIGTLKDRSASHDTENDLELQAT